MKTHKNKRELAFMRIYSLDLSRRRLLKGLAGASAGATIATVAVSPVAAKGWKSKASVAYQDHPRGHERCEICAPFLPPDQCRTVVGSVSRQGWCTAYEGA
jgi:hypothetical protein